MSPTRFSVQAFRRASPRGPSRVASLGIRHHEHPTPDLLFRFFLGEASKTENRAIVRHLLAGCPGCVDVSRPLWWLADGRRRGRKKLRPARERRA